MYHRKDLTKSLVEAWIAETGSVRKAAAKYAGKVEKPYGGSFTPASLRSVIANVLSGTDQKHIPELLRNESEEQDLNRLRELLHKSNVPLSAIKNLTQKDFKIKSWGYAMKLREQVGVDSKGDPIYEERPHEQSLYSVELAPGTSGREWPMIRPADPINVVFKSMREVRGDGVSAGRGVFIWPDTQIGYYRSSQTGVMVAFHDEDAIDVALQMLERFCDDCAAKGMPVEVVLLGDFLDLPAMSRWPQYPEYQRMLQPAVFYAHHLLARMRAIVGPKARMRYVPGNHERRLAEYVAKNAAELLGLRSAEKDIEKIDQVTMCPKEWKAPHISLQELLHLGHLGVEYLPEYPSAQCWLTDKAAENQLVAVHRRERQKDLRATVIAGHEEQVDRKARTIHYRDPHDDNGSLRHEYDTIIVPGLINLEDVDDPSMLTRSRTPSNGTRKKGQQAVATVLLFPNGRFNVEVHRMAYGIGEYRDTQFRSGAVPQNQWPFKQ